MILQASFILSWMTIRPQVLLESQEVDMLNSDLLYVEIPTRLSCWKLVTIVSKLGYFTNLGDVSNLLILGL